MKTLQTLLKGLFVLTALIFWLSLPAAAQNESRMQQDLRISQGILSELLKTESGSGLTFARTSNSGMKSTYIPGYGVIFESTVTSFPFSPEVIETINVTGGQGEDRDVQVRVRGTASTSAGNSSQTMNFDERKAQVMTYFKDYADLIGQLPASERISVIVRPSSGHFYSILSPSTASGTSSSNQVSTTSVRAGQVSTTSTFTSNIRQQSGFIMSVKRSDVSAFKSGSIDEAQFTQRVTTTEIQSESSSEIRIFERILETGLSSEVNPTFSLGRDLISVHDANTGLLILGSIRGGNQRAVFFREIELDSLREVTVVRGFDTLQAPRIVLRGNAVTLDRSIDTITVDLRRANEQLERARAELAKVRELQISDFDVSMNLARFASSEPTRTKEEVESDLEKFIESTKDLLIDYGRTLDTVQSGQNIMLYLELRNAGSDLPSKLIFSVNKQVIDNFSNRSLSKEAAKNQISVIRQ
jgi:hypothetical protein